MRQLFLPLLALTFAAFPNILLAQSVTPSADSTGTIVTPNGNQFDITGGTRAGDNLFQSFQRFGLDPNQAANFIADPSLRNILGRVVGGDPSVINGLIQVTGGSPNLYLMNPAGIIFGPSAILNVPADFTATTATGIGFGTDSFSAVGTNNYANLVGDPTSFAFSLSQPGALVNAGNLSVAEGQSLNLVGGTVVNTGSLSAPGGSVTVMAVPGTSRIRLSQPGSLLSLEVDRHALSPTGTPAPTLPELITGTGTSQATGLTVEADGTVRLANTALPSAAGTSIVSGTISVLSSAGTGGTIHVLGDTVGLLAAQVEASGSAGGGTVLIGGDYKGEGMVPNAQLTVVDSASVVRADGGQLGTGGRVILWADGLTRFSGEISAQGGSQTGDGGFVEVSGKQQLSFAGLVDLSAPNGQLGSLLLDPQNITISATLSAPAGPGGVDDQFLNLTPGSILTTDFLGLDISLEAAVLESQAAAITLEATNNITIDPGLSLTFVPGGPITFTAGGAFSMDSFQSITAQGDIANNGRDITISAASITVGVIDTTVDVVGSATNAGSIRLLSSGGDITTSTLNTSVINGSGAAGNITLDVAGGTGTIDTPFLLASSVSGPSGDISLTANSIAVSGDIDTSVNDDIFFAAVDAGSIQILSSGGDITATRLITDVINGEGVAGNITLSVTGGIGNIAVGSISAFGVNNSGGTVSLTAQGGNISTGAIQTASNTTLPGSTGGDITLQTIGNGSINTTGGELLSRAVNDGNSSGLIILTTVDGNIVTGNLTSGSGGFNSLGSDIVLTATGAGAIDTRGGIILSGSGAGSGIIELTTNTGNIAAGELTSASGIPGLGGAVSLTASNGSITFNSNVITGGGSITATANAATGSGITVAGNLFADSGDITIDGISGGAGAGAIGVDAFSGTIGTGDGTITITGSNTNPASDAPGLSIAIPITTTTGSLTLAGNSAGVGPSARGVFLNFGGNLTTTSGDVIITGENLNTTGGSRVVYLNGGNIITDSGKVTLDGTSAGVTAEAIGTFVSSFSSIATNSGAVSITGDSTNSLGDGQGVNISGTIDAGSGPITLNGITAGSGSPFSSGIVLGGTVTTTGEITAIGTGTNPTNDAPGLLVTGTVDGGDLNLQGSSITTTGGNLSGTAFNITSSSTVNLGNITGTDLAGSPIVITSSSNIVTGDLNSSGFTGGLITLESDTGSITTGNINSTGFSAGPGGDVTLISPIGITTGNINSSALTGNGGNVFIDPARDVQVGFINAQGGASGTGGSIDITTGSLFRATDTFIDQNNILASISTAGATGNGKIAIRHGGGGTTPFIVGNSALNGTAGAITTGPDTLQPTALIPSGLFTQGNITIETEIVPSEPSPEPPTPEPSPEPPTPEPSPPNLEVPPDVQTDLDPEPDTTQDVPDLGPVAPNTSLAAQQITSFETQLNAEFTSYLGEAAIPNLTVAQTQRKLLDVTGATGIKPAIIYVGFAPGSVGQSLPSAPALSQTAIKRTASASSATAQLQPIAEAGDNPNNAIFWQFTHNGLSLAARGDLAQGSQTKRDSDELELLMVTGEGQIIRKRIAGVTRKQVLASAIELRSEVTDPLSSGYLTPAQQLYQWLIAPLEAEMKSEEVKNLVFIMDGGLRTVPIAALHDGQDFIITKYSVGMMPSLSLTDTTRVDIRNAPVLAMGASQFQDLNPLPAVPKELEVIESSRGGARFLNEAFTLANLKQQRQQTPYPIIHLATHGEFKPGDLSQSFIQFWDTRLELSQIRQLRLYEPVVELMVLSACRTAIGSEEAELGFAGFAFKAGVRSVLGSLWYVSDEGTLGLMSEFYQQLTQAPIRAEALRKAQLAMLRGEVKLDQGQLRTTRGAIELPSQLADVRGVDLTHPYYWSAFTMVGNPW